MPQTSKSVKYHLHYLFLRYSSIPLAPALPAPMARITVAAPVTASPPAWDAYEVAVNEMLQKTNTSFAPWHVLESVDKKYARIKALRIVISEIEKALKEN